MKNAFLSAALIAALAAGSASAEVIELTCTTSPLSGQEFPPATLVFDTDERTARFAFWPESQAIVWDDDFIMWQSHNAERITAASFLYNRSSGELLIEVVTPNRMATIRDPESRATAGLPLDRCTRLF